VQGVVCPRGHTAQADGACEVCPPGWTTRPRAFPQLCSEPCSAEMLASSATSGCSGAWFVGTRSPDGCSQGSCREICASRGGRSCALAALFLVNTREVSPQRPRCSCWSTHTLSLLEGDLHVDRTVRRCGGERWGSLGEGIGVRVCVTCD
jgi:hypothetical protein